MPFTLAEQESQFNRAGTNLGVNMPTKMLRSMRRIEEKNYPDVSVITTGASPITLFTVTGLVIARIVGFSGSALASTGTNGTIAIGVTGATTLGLGTTTVDGTNFPAANTVWIDTSPTLLGEAIVATNLTGFLTASNIIMTVATNSLTTGSLKIYCIWEPISPDAAVVAA